MLSVLRKLIPDRSPLRLTYHKLIAIAAAIRYGFPANRMKVIAVTGTNGKSTTVNLIARMLTHAGYKVGMTSTINFKVADEEWANDTKQTTQGRFALQKLLRKMADRGCQYAVIEVTSHALTQSRLWGINVDTAVFTNITPDHIEYHGGFENYLRAKGKLFSMLGRLPHKRAVSKTSILNRDDANFPYFDRFYAEKKLTYGIAQGTVHASGISLRADSTNFTLHIPNESAEVSLKLPGQVNVYNALAATAVGLSENIPLKTIAKALSQVSVMPGRLETISCGQLFTVVVDYAHDPEALEKILALYKEVTKGKLISVFGATGGGRDKGKRPHMGRVADKYADFIIVTDDDPYDEDEYEIIEQISKGISRKEGEKFWKVPNRRLAIRLALTIAGEGDTVVISGKGCEPVQIVHNEKRPWDDRKVVKELLTREMKVAI